MSDINSKIFDAFISDGTAQATEISINSKKKYIFNKSAQLSLAETRDIMKILTLDGLTSKIKKAAEGSTINLALVGDETITKIYNYMVFKLEKSKS